MENNEQENKVEEVQEEPVKEEKKVSNNIILIIILIVILLGVTVAMIIYFMNYNKKSINNNATTTNRTTTTNGVFPPVSNEPTTTTTTAVVRKGQSEEWINTFNCVLSNGVKKCDIVFETVDASYAKTFYLENKVLYAVPSELSKITLGNDAKKIDGKKVYKVAENVDTFYSYMIGQGGYRNALYISNGDLYEIALYDASTVDKKDNRAPLSVTKTEYKNVSRVIRCDMSDSFGYIVINKDDQIIADKRNNKYVVFYDEKTAHFVNNVNGDLITFKEVKISETDSGIKVSVKLEYNGKTIEGEYETLYSVDKETTTIGAIVEKKGDTYIVAMDYYIN